MSSSLIGSSTTSSSPFLDARTSNASPTCSNMLSCIAGTIVISVLLSFAFVLTCCHLRGFIRTDKADEVTLVEPESVSKDAPHADKLESPRYPASQDVYGGDASSLSTKDGSSMQSLQSEQSWTCTNFSDGGDVPLQEKPYIESGASGSWVGSEEWAAARALRKMRLNAILQSSLWASARNTKHIEPAIETKIPQAPLCTPPVLEVSPPSAPPLNQCSVLEVAPPCINMIQDEGSEKIAQANAEIQECLQNTLGEDMETRKKTFKVLCSRWHPDKNAPADASVATEVFQYLQAQKMWYLISESLC